MAGRGLEAGQLFAQICRVSASALASGALVPLTTSVEHVLLNGVSVELRFMERTKRKDDSKTKRAPGFNPFKNPEPELTVCALGDHHTAVLNKFNVVANHFLIVTNEYKPQNARLEPRDFEAVSITLKEHNFLVFFNSAKEAGSSEDHRHLQLIPLPIGDSEEFMVPIEGIFSTPSGGVQSSLPFRHRCHMFENPAAIAKEAYDFYLEAISALDCDPDSATRSVPAYNLLLTRKWMLLIPRISETAGELGFNAMVFAGCILTKAAKHKEWVIHEGVNHIWTNLAGKNDSHTPQITE